MRTIIFLVLLAVGAFAADRPEGKSGKRLDKIEQDYGVQFVQVMEYSINGKRSNFWMFSHPKGDNTPLYAFSTPANPSNETVEYCMASSSATAIFYLFLFQKMMAQPSATPTNLL